MRARRLSRGRHEASTGRRLLGYRRVEIVEARAVGQRQLLQRPFVLREQPEVGVQVLSPLERRIRQADRARRRHTVLIHVGQHGNVAAALHFRGFVPPLLVHADLHVVGAGRVGHIRHRVPDLIEVVLGSGRGRDGTHARRRVEMLDVERSVFRLVIEFVRGHGQRLTNLEEQAAGDR